MSEASHSPPTSRAEDARAKFEELYRQWGPVVKAAARPYVTCQADAEDAMQRVFARLWRSGGWMEIESPKTYFHIAGFREAMTMTRASGRRHEFHSHAIPPPNPPPRSDDRVLADERRAITSRLLNRLPPRCREVMYLRLIEDLTRREVTNRLGIRVGGVEKQIARGRRLLRGMSGSRDALTLLSTFEDGGG